MVQALSKEKDLNIFSNITKDTDISTIISNLDSGIKNLFESGNFKKYLNFLSSFYSYSVNNTFLIMMQNPDSSFVGSYTFWKSKNRYVKKNEHGLKIMAPTTEMRTCLVKQYDENKNPIYENGIHKTKEELVPFITGYKWTTVFDVSQTDGEPLPSIVKKLDKTSPVSKIIQNIITEVSSCPIHYKEIKQNGYYDVDKNEIVINNSLSGDATAKTLIHEYAHSILHKNITDYSSLRGFYEMQAEGIAYTVLQRYNLDTSDYSFGYVAHWTADLKEEQYKQALSIIRQEASSIIGKIDTVIEKEWELYSIKRKEEISKELKRNHIFPKEKLIKDIFILEQRSSTEIDIRKLCEGNLHVPNEQAAIYKINTQISQQILEM